MYQITCDGYVLHDSRMDKVYRVISPVYEQSLNTAGTLSFQIPPTHPYYSAIHKLKSKITLTQDGEWIFTGRVMDDEKKFNNVKSIKCQGELSFLNDSNQRKAEYHDISVADYFSTVISKHNAMVEADKQFTVGQVTVTDPNDSLYRISNYENTYDTINDKLINKLGGYIRTRHSGSTVFIDYLADYTNINNQTINFGKNLLDLNEKIKGSKIATAIIPLGAKLEDSEARLTIESVNDGLDYVCDSDAVALYGYVFDTVVFDDVTLPENLKTKGQQELASRKLLEQKLELSAVDLHLLDVSIERIKLGDKIRVLSTPHGIDKYMMVSSVSISIDKPSSSKIKLGETISALTDMTNKDTLQGQIENIITDYGFRADITNIRNNINELSSSISQTAQNILLQVYSNCASKDDVESVNELLSSSIEILNNMIEFKFNTVDSHTTTVEGVVTENQQLLEEYIRFQGALIQLGKVGNAFTAELSNEKLAFLQNNIEIAYVSNNKLYITDAEIKNKLTIGNATNGYFDFIPRANGNLSLKWRAN